MQRLIKGFTAIVLILCLVLSFSVIAATPQDYSVQTPEKLEAGHLYGESCIVINAETGHVLFEKNADARRYPASTTKIMTCILGIEWAESQGMLDSLITIPSNIAVSSDSSKMGISTGDRMTFSDLLYGMMLSSGNDAALAVAMLVSGSTQGFVNLMNDKLGALGISTSTTHYVNVHGLHEVNHYTTARDLAKIMAYAMKNETFRSIIGATEHTVVSDYWPGPEGKTFTTKYDLINPSSQLYYAPCVGGKTGYTRDAGRSFVGAAEQNGLTLVSVSLKPKKIDEADKSYVEAFTDTIRLFKYGFLQYDFKSFKDMCLLCDSSLLSLRVPNAANDDPNGGYLELSITDIPGNYAEGYLKSELNDAARMDEITKDFSGRIRIELTNNEVRAPLSAGDVIGKAFFTGKDSAVYEGHVVASRDVAEQPPTMDQVVDEWLDGNAPWLKVFSPRHNPAAWFIYIALLGVIVFLIVWSGRKRRRRNRARRAAYERRKREYMRRMQREEYLRKHPEARASAAAKKTSANSPKKH